MNHSFTPSTTEELELDEIENKYFYGILDHCIKTEKGKEIVRDHAYPTPNARKCWEELVTVMTTKAKIMISELME